MTNKHNKHTKNTDFTPWPPEFADQYRQLGYWQGEAFGPWLSNLAKKYGAQVALIEGEQRLTYRQLNNLALRYATHFQKQGLKQGDRVVLQLPNSIDFFGSLFGLLGLGIQPILSLPAHRQQEVSYFAQLAEAKAYLAPAEHAGFNYLPLARFCLENAESLERILILGESDFPSLSPDENTLLLSQWPEISASDIALFQLSGGSTGKPKLIPRTHDDYLYSIRASAEICNLNEHTVKMIVLPVSHNYPLTSPGSLGVFHAGGTVVLSPQASPETAFPLIQQHGVTQVALVPTLLSLWLQAAEHSSSNLSSLQTIQCGGAPLSPDLARRVPEIFNCDLQQVFGMAEGLVNYTRPQDPNRFESQGFKISPHDEIKILDDQDNEVPDGTAGHLLTRGPYTVRGYFRAPEHNTRAFTSDGFYRTGDIVTRHPDGFLTVTGRSKDQVNRSGEKIAAEEVEHALHTHPQVLTAALVGVPDQWLGERSVAFVALKDASTPPRFGLELKKYLIQLGLATYKIPDQIQILPKVPQTAVGKINKVALRELAAQPQKTPNNSSKQSKESS